MKALGLFLYVHGRDNFNAKILDNTVNYLSSEIFKILVMKKSGSGSALTNNDRKLQIRTRIRI